MTDGVHTEPTLREGRSYQLNVVCFGSGRAEVTFTPSSAGRGAEVACDQSVVLQRITAHGPLHIDVGGTKGSSGVIAWQIDAV